MYHFDIGSSDLKTKTKQIVSVRISFKLAFNDAICLTDILVIRSLYEFKVMQFGSENLKSVYFGHVHS